MHIGIDVRFWNETGVGRYIRNLIAQLQRIDRTNNYTLFALKKNENEVKSQITNDKFQVVVADIRWHTLKEQIAFPGLLEKQDLDLVHFPYFSVPIFYTSPYVITIHDLILHHFPTGEASTLPLPIYNLKHAGYKFIIQKAAQNAKSIITVTKATKEEIVSHLNVAEDKINVIYEGMDDNLSKNTRSSSDSIPTFLHVGNLYPHKNMDRVLEAINILHHQKVELKLVIVSRKDFFYKKFYNKVIAAGLDEYVIFKGEVSDRELGELYATSTATVIPSLMEGFGLPALEAMGNKCLVVASKIPSLKEICGDAPIYFEPLDTKDIAEKISKVLSMSVSDKKKKINLGYNRAQQFSWEKMGQETLEIYESSAGIRQNK